MSKLVNIYYAGLKKRAGGVYNHVINIEKGLKEMGYDVRVIALDNLHISIRYIPYLLQKIGNFANFPFGFLWKQQFIKYIYKILYYETSDIEIFEDIYLYWQSKTDSIVILHALWSDNLQAYELSYTKRVALEKQETKIMNKIDSRIVTVSEAYKTFILSRLVCLGLKKEINVVELGVDIDKFKQSLKNDNSMVYSGALEARKNIYFLLDIFAKLVIADDSFTLVIIGDGAEREDIQKYIIEKNIPNISFTGRLNYNEVVDKLSDFTYYIHTSTKESFSYSLLEAKLSGLTTIAYSRLEVPKEFIDIKVDKFEVDEWVKDILNFKNDISSFSGDIYSHRNMTKKTIELL